MNHLKLVLSQDKRQELANRAEKLAATVAAQKEFEKEAAKAEKVKQEEGTQAGLCGDG